jgi:hypothetical protein
MNRRHFMKHLAGLSALAIPGMQFVQRLRAAEATLKREGKSLVVLWMGGGPSHLDLWDMKPGETNGGEFKPMKTAVSGVEISEMLPTVADQMKHLSIIRSLSSGEADHMRGTQVMNTGFTPNPIVPYPSIGSVVSSMLTSKELPLPGFIGIGGTAQRIGPGFLGSLYAPFTVQNPGQPPQNIKTPNGVDDDRMRRRQSLFYDVEEEFNARLYPGTKAADRKEDGSAGDAHETVYDKAFKLTVSPLRTVFEVRNEDKKTLEMYGGERNNFGMGCLLARKLIEKGVSCVEVDLGGWDNHANIFPTIKNSNGPRLDKGMSALVKDLVDRGMWKNTVLVWMGDFGRTPRINQNAGRDHWARCWSVVVGGGAIKGGQVYGATSKDGTDIEKDKVSVGDLFATLYKGLGLDPDTKVRDNLSRPISIANGKPISALF